MRIPEVCGERDATSDESLRLSEVRRAFSISEFCQRYSVGRTVAYAEIAAGRLQALKLGRRTLISLDGAEEWLRALPKMGGHRER